jgi:type I restriction enzyme S subunit
MRLEAFFEKFELFAVAPDAVAKMRELVLELAVRGMLGDHLRADSNDDNRLEPKIQPRADSIATANTSPFEIPRSWSWTTLDEVGDTKPRNEAADDAVSSFVPMSYVAAEYGRSVQHDVRSWGEIKKGYTHFKNGDVVMAKITPCFENGKSAVVSGLSAGFGAGTTELHVFRGNKGALLPEFAIIFLKSRGFIARGVPRMTGSAGQKRVPHDYFARSPFPLPPIAEQKRIVAKVDELMTLCDRLEAQQQERQARHTALARASLSRFAEAPIPANLDFLFHDAYVIDPANLRKAIRALAVQGKLVSQDPAEEPAESAIARIYMMRSTVKAKDFPPVGISEIQYDAPTGWAWVRLGNLAITSDSGWSPQCSSEARSGTDWGVLKVSAVSWGVFKPEENKSLPPGIRPRPDCEVKAGDFLLSRANTEDLVARSVIVDEAPPHLMMSDKIVRFTFPDEIVGAYINLANSSDQSRAYYARNASGTSSSMKNIGREVMCNLPIPLPPVAEQWRIVAKVAQLMALVDQLEAKLEATRKAGATLLNAAINELLNPQAVEPLQLRIAVGCHIVRKLSGSRFFGRTKNMKALYLAQAHVGVAIDLHSAREAAGPLDPWIYQFERQAAREHWFETIEPESANGNTKVEYRPGPQLQAKAALATEWLPASQLAELDRLLDLLADKTAEETEIIATLFAAWNDALIDGASTSDDDIIREVRDNWHERKQRFTPAKLKHWIHWLDANNLVPRGHPPRTNHQPHLFL